MKKLIQLAADRGLLRYNRSGSAPINVDDVKRFAADIQPTLMAALEAAESREAELRARVAELEKYEALEPLLESLVDYCNNVSLCCIDEVIAATAGLERLYRARKAAAPKEEA